MGSTCRKKVIRETARKKAPHLGAKTNLAACAFNLPPKKSIRLEIRPGTRIRRRLAAYWRRKNAEPETRRRKRRISLSMGSLGSSKIFQTQNFMQNSNLARTGRSPVGKNYYPRRTWMLLEEKRHIPVPNPDSPPVPPICFQKSPSDSKFDREPESDVDWPLTGAEKMLNLKIVNVSVGNHFVTFYRFAWPPKNY